MRSYWYRNFEDPTIYVTVATNAKFLRLKFQNRFTHAKLRRWDLIFRYCPIIRTCSFTWTGWNKILPTPYKFPVLFRPRAIVVYRFWWIWLDGLLKLKYLRYTLSLAHIQILPRGSDLRLYYHSQWLTHFSPQFKENRFISWCLPS